MKPAILEADWPTVAETPSERPASDYLKGGPLRCIGRPNPPADREVGSATFTAGAADMAASAACPDAGSAYPARRRGTPTNPENEQAS